MAIDVNRLEPADRVLLAVDATERERALELLGVARSVGANSVKLGQELFSAPGVGGVEGATMDLARGIRVLVDGKTHDIGKTVVSTVRNITGYDPLAFTVGGLGAGSWKAVEQAQQVAGDIPCLGLTVPSDVGDAECLELYKRPRLETVLFLANKAVDCGLQGIVVSGGEELAAVNEDPRLKHLLKLVPGIRPDWSNLNGQKRENILTPEKAIQLNATWLVIGSPIHQAHTNTDPRFQTPAAAYQQILSEIEPAINGGR
jgi:orotidine-5'-phosphate decarboxylase